MIYVASRPEAAGTIKTGLKSGVIERLAGGALAVCPNRDHDRLADELHHRFGAESVVIDVSDLLTPAGDPGRPAELEVVYLTTDSTLEPAADLLDHAMKIIEALVTLPRTIAVSIPHLELGALSAFLIVPNEQRWLRSIVGGILGGRR